MAAGVFGGMVEVAGLLRETQTECLSSKNLRLRNSGTSREGYSESITSESRVPETKRGAVWSSGMIRLFVADTSPMASQLLADALRRFRNPRFEVATPKSVNPDDCLSEILQQSPDVAVLALALQNHPLGALQIVRELRLLAL